MKEIKETTNNLKKGQNGSIHDVDIIAEMEELMRLYGIEVVTERALPDLRDGLKNVHRHIIFALYKARLFFKSKTIKSANIVGDIIGKYHPHGDIATYESIVRAAQPFTLRYPLVFGQGNFGSIDGDPAAAFRYTEVKMTKIAEELVKDLEKDVVSFKKNYDDRLNIPVILPSFFPNLLANGSIGIGVGFATNIPPHNLTELINATVALIQNPEINIEELLKYISGPDFPTGAFIITGEQLKQAYMTGRGYVVIRAKTHIEKEDSSALLVITEIPYLLKKTNLIIEITKLIEMKIIKGVVDFRDESNYEGIRIVLEFKKERFIEYALNKLYLSTSLQRRFHINFCALYKKKPAVYNLKELLVLYIEHQIEVINRRALFELNGKQKRYHEVIGLVKALNNDEKVREIIDDSDDSTDGIPKLMQFLNISEAQANGIWDMKYGSRSRLRRLKLKQELISLEQGIKDLQKLIASKKEQDILLIRQLLEIKNKFGDKRRTKIIINGREEITQKDLLIDEQVLVILSANNYIKRVLLTNYRLQKKGGKGKKGISFKENDVLKLITVASTRDKILFFSNKGKCYRFFVGEIPDYERESRGIPIIRIIENLKKDEHIQTVLIYNDKISPETELFFVTKKAIVKKTKIEHFHKINKSGKISISLEKDDSLKDVFFTNKNDEIFIASFNGKIIRFKTNRMRSISRTARGVKGMLLKDNDFVVAAAALGNNKNKYVLTVSNTGIGKLVTEESFRVVSRNRKGILVLNIKKANKKIGNLVSIKIVDPLEHDLLISTNDGKIKRIELKNMIRKARNAVGIKLMSISKNKQKVVSVTIVNKNIF